MSASLSIWTEIVSSFPTAAVFHVSLSAHMSASISDGDRKFHYIMQPGMMKGSFLLNFLIK